MNCETSTKSALRRRSPAFKLSELYKVRLVVSASGERIPLLVDAACGLPVNRPNQFILVTRRDRCQVSTLSKELRILGIVLGWASRNDLDLHTLLDNGKGFEHAQVTSLVETLRGDFGDAAGYVILMTRPVVAAATWAHRISVARDYIAWNLERALRAAEPGSLRYQHISDVRRSLIQRMRDLMPKARSTSERRGLDESLRSRLLEILVPQSVENPFHKLVRGRNALVIELMIATGLRRGEVLKIRTADVSVGARATLHIERRPDDPDDPRLHEPQVKTRGRKIPLDAAVASKMSKYILDERRLLPNARRSPFLFLSRKGKPLTLRGLDNIFAQILLRHPEFCGHLTPHVLRHTANDLLSEVFEQSGCTNDEAKEIRNHLMGWEPNSEQGVRYSRAHIERLAQKVSLDHQRRIFGNGGE